jgi:site-specific DNA-methyltransferase (adenine-specific)
MTFREEQIGPCRLILGDCLEVLPLLAKCSVDLVITSPPYNLGNTTGGGFPLGHYSSAGGITKRSGCGKWSGGDLVNGYGAHDDNMPHHEYVEWQRTVLTECWRLIRNNGAIFYNHKPRVLGGILVTPFDYLPADVAVRQIVIWQRAGGINFSPAFYLPTHEWVMVIAPRDFRLKSKGASGVGDVWYIPQESNTEHPAPFPLDLPLKILETVNGLTVLDPFMGSGTVAVACIQEERKFVGCELEPR